MEQLRKGGIEPIEDRILAALEAANAAVYQHALENPNCRGMGTTMVLALAFKSKYVAANVGDSRLYFFDGQALTQISHDHSYVAQLVAAGRSPQNRPCITLAGILSPGPWYPTGGTGGSVRGEWKQGDMLLLCSDGLYGVLDDREMARILREEPDLDAACEQLVRNACTGGQRITSALC